LILEEKMSKAIEKYVDDALLAQQSKHQPYDSVQKVDVYDVRRLEHGYEVQAEVTTGYGDEDGGHSYTVTRYFKFEDGRVTGHSEYHFEEGET
jgi:hypothetical protein